MGKGEILHYKLLQSAEIYNEDYAQIFKMANERDFVFLDPPYDCIFSDYGNKDYKNGFGEAEHRRLASDFKNISSQTMLVIGKTPLTMELYRKYIIEEYDKKYCTYFLSNKNQDLKKNQTLVIS